MVPSWRRPWCRCWTATRPSALAARVLALEHPMYAQAVRWFVEDKLVVDGNRVRQLDGAAQLWT
jgi:folate-dependent phosphoribosylglycinamide formyltransferase PurN